jgi:hypothetical protein
VLRTANATRCRPPLPDAEILAIAKSASTYPVGGPDPLETAWAAVCQQTHRNGYEQFLALARELQAARPDMPIALPLERISALMGRHWTKYAAGGSTQCVPCNSARLYLMSHTVGRDCTSCVALLMP